MAKLKDNFDFTWMMKLFVVIFNLFPSSNYYYLFLNYSMVMIGRLRVKKSRTSTNPMKLNFASTFFGLELRICSELPLGQISKIGQKGFLDLSPKKLLAKFRLHRISKSATFFYTQTTCRNWLPNLISSSNSNFLTFI